MKISNVDRKTIARAIPHLHLCGGEIFEETKMMGFEHISRMFPSRLKFERISNLALYSLYTFKYPWRIIYVNFIKTGDSEGVVVHRSGIHHGTSLTIADIADETLPHTTGNLGKYTTITRSGWTAVADDTIELDNQNIIDFMRSYIE